MASTPGQTSRRFRTAVIAAALTSPAVTAAAADGSGAGTDSVVYIVLTFLFAVGLAVLAWRVTHLTQRVAASHQRLLDAAEGVSDAFSLFDANDRLVVWNDRLTEFFPGYLDVVGDGVPFATLVRASAENGDIAEA